MANRQKAKGDAYERDVQRFLLGEGFVMAERIPAGATLDVGDLLLPADIPLTIDCKNQSRFDISGWVDRAAEQARNARRTAGFVVVKRRGTTDVAQHYALTTVRMLTDLLIHHVRENR